MNGASFRGTRMENTCTSLLCDSLRKLGVDAQFEEHFLTVFGINKPDIHIKYNGNDYLLEAKQSPKTLVDAVSKAYTYKEKLTQISPKAVFAVVYPRECIGNYQSAVLLSEPPFYSAYSADSIEELSKWIMRVLSVPPSSTEINTADAIRLLRDAVNALVGSFSKLGLGEVEEMFGGKIFFETILGMKQESQIPLSHLHHAAAYLLVNQIMFHQILAYEKKDETTGKRKYRKIESESIIEPKELHEKYFSLVLEEDYTPIFGFEISKRLKGKEATEALKITIDAINALAPQFLNHDILGKIFHNLIPFELRKVIAAFYTNTQAGEMLAFLSINDSTSTVLDPACGSGTLLVSAYHRKRELIESSGRMFQFLDHKRFLEEEITGIDIMPFAAHLAAVHLSLQAPLYTADFIRVAIEDSTRLRPGDKISSAHAVLKNAFAQRTLIETTTQETNKNRTTVAGIVRLGNEREREIKLSKVDLVIMNPPFTRYQRIPKTYKEVLARRFSEERYSECLGGQLGLHGYFLLLADRFLSDGGRIAAVLPITTLSAKGTQGFLDILLNQYSIEHLIACEGRYAFSENTAVREILLVARKKREEANNIGITIIKISPDDLTTSQSQNIATAITKLRSEGIKEEIVDNSEYSFKLLAQKEAIKDKLALFRAISVYRKDISLVDKAIRKIFNNSRRTVSFRTYLKSVKCEIHESPRGIGELGFYGLSFLNKEKRALRKHDYWYITEKRANSIKIENRVSHITLDIPKKCIRPSIRRYTGLASFNISNQTDFVVSDKFEGIRDLLDKGFETAKKKKKALGLLAKGAWSSLIEDNSAYLALIYRARISNANHLAFFSSKPMFMGGSFWMLKMQNAKQSKILCLWLNSTLNLFQWFVNRKETEGAWMWVDDYVMGTFLMPDLSKLSNSETADLLKLFGDLGKKKFPSLLEQLKSNDPMRYSIDETFLNLLGVKKEEINQLLQRIYSVLAAELEQLEGKAQSSESYEE